ncbi:MAG: DUF1016 N-terminal domain-containing protein [Phormidesmis sp. CAN_BIN44]|nr:DUF1016 N-terminal domain-containing protein [Phormidesmis sp. CAN_BIN44]
MQHCPNPVGYGYTLSNTLSSEYGKGFSRRNVFRMIRFAEVFPDEQIVSTLSGSSELLVISNDVMNSWLLDRLS